MHTCFLNAGWSNRPQRSCNAVVDEFTDSAAISEPLGTSGRAFGTFPEYELATGWRFQTVFDTFQESNMATGKPEML